MHLLRMSNYPRLFSSLPVGDLKLSHRVVMAPLTRMRSSQPGDIPNPLNAEYYAQRATPGGLLISEATQISRQGKGYPAAPGIHSAEQVDGWLDAATLSLAPADMAEIANAIDSSGAGSGPSRPK